MQDYSHHIKQAISHTQVIRPPEQLLATFGQTSIHYYILTEPIYTAIEDGSSSPETVLRQGIVVAEQPKLVTPFYLQRLEGFGDQAQEYFNMIAESIGPNAPGLLYSYKNEPGDLSILSGNLPEVAERINSDIIKRDEKKAAIIRGLDDIWDVSLFKFIYDLTESSIRQNILELHQKGYLSIDKRGITVETRVRIERLFGQLRNGEIDPIILKSELDRWDIFNEYQDRFFSTIRDKRV